MAKNIVKKVRKLNNIPFVNHLRVHLRTTTDIRYLENLIPRRIKKSTQLRSPLARTIWKYECIDIRLTLEQEDIFFRILLQLICNSNTNFWLCYLKLTRNARTKKQHGLRFFSILFQKPTNYDKKVFASWCIIYSSETITSWDKFNVVWVRSKSSQRVESLSVLFEVNFISVISCFVKNRT